MFLPVWCISIAIIGAALRSSFLVLHGVPPWQVTENEERRSDHIHIPIANVIKRRFSDRGVTFSLMEVGPLVTEICILCFNLAKNREIVFLI